MAYWLAAAALLFAAEMFLGTVYLLVLSAAVAGAALAAWLFGVDSAAPWWAASLLSLVGVTVVYRYRRRTPELPAADNDLDVGETVLLHADLGGGLWQVSYRGALWEARLDASDTSRAHAGGRARITGKDGIVLIIQAV